MALLLLSVGFREPVFIPGAGGTGGLSEFPPAKGGWAALDGWSMRVVGDRLEIWSALGVTPPAAHKAELAANRIDEERAVSVVTVPLAMCILRYGGYASDEPMPTGAPVRSVALGKTVPEPTTVVVVAAKATPEVATVTVAPLSAPNRPPPPAPAPRRPPGARGPSKPTNVVRDLDDDEQAKHVAAKVRRELETEPAFGGEGEDES